MKSEKEIDWNYGRSHANILRKYTWEWRTWTFQSKPTLDERKVKTGRSKFKNVIIGIWLFIEIYIINWWDRKYAQVKCKRESLLATKKFSERWKGMIEKVRDVNS